VQLQSDRDELAEALQVGDEAVFGLLANHHRAELPTVTACSARWPTLKRGGALAHAVANGRVHMPTK
jgi:hypothetical protein